MLSRFLPVDRHLRRAVVGFLVFVILSLVAGGLAAWEEFRQGEFGRDQEDLAQVVWKYGLASAETATAIEQMGDRPRAKELLALLDPATGRAVAAWPSRYAGETPEEMVLDSGVKLPSLQMVQGFESFRLRRFSPGQSGVATATMPRIRALLERGQWVRVRLAHLYPWRKEGLRIRKTRDTTTLPLIATTPPTAEHDDDRDEKFDKYGRLSVSPPPIGYLLLVSAPRLVTTLGASARVAGGLAAVALLLYWLSIAWWVFIDARRRGNRPFAWGMLALLTNLVGLAIYMIARRQWLQCPSCTGKVETNFRNCPWCGDALVAVCAKCSQPLQRGWTHCATCGAAATLASP